MLVTQSGCDGIDGIPTRSVRGIRTAGERRAVRQRARDAAGSVRRYIRTRIRPASQRRGRHSARGHSEEAIQPRAAETRLRARQVVWRVHPAGARSRTGRVVRILTRPYDSCQRADGPPRPCIALRLRIRTAGAVLAYQLCPISRRAGRRARTSALRRKHPSVRYPSPPITLSKGILPMRSYSQSDIYHPAIETNSFALDCARPVTGQSAVSRM